MAAKTSESEKARLFDLVTTVCELVRDGRRDSVQVSGVLQQIKENPSFYQKFFPPKGEALSKSSGKSPRSELKLWTKFYVEVFGEKKDFSKLKLPVAAEGFNWLLIMAKGLTASKIWAKMIELKIPCYKYVDDLDQITSDRNVDEGDYAIRLRDRVEADEELKNKSAEDLKQEGIQGITLPERLLLGLFHHWKTGGHLDRENWTLCSGSRYSVGGVPYVSWGGDEVCVDWYDPQSRSDYLRSRQAVS